MSDPVAVGVDVGGTKLVAATLGAGGEVLDRRRETSPVADPRALLATVEALVRDVAGDAAGHLPVGIGVAGIVASDGTLAYSPNLRVEQVPLGPGLREALGVTVTVGNDANVALYGEHRAGAARQARDAVMVTLGTGVGGGLLVDGRLVRGGGGYAGELGHVIVREGGRPCPCGNRGCVEAYSSGTAIGAMARERLADPGAASSLEQVDDVDGRAVTRAAHDGDPLAREILHEAGWWLGVALASIVNAVDPELVVVGGGASMQAAGFVLPPATSSMGERLLGRERRTAPPIVLAQLGDDAGMIGAGLLARDSVDTRGGSR